LIIEDLRDGISVIQPTIIWRSLDLFKEFQ
jgi:hypothetical protein